MKLRHVVLFGFKTQVSEAEISVIVERFAALREKVPGIEAFEWGVNHSAEGHDHGLTHAFVLTFADASVRDAYLVHPNHVLFAQWVGQFLESVTVVDYLAQASAP